MTNSMYAASEGGFPTESWKLPDSPPASIHGEAFPPHSLRTLLSLTPSSITSLLSQHTRPSISLSHCIPPFHRSSPLTHLRTACAAWQRMKAKMTSARRREAVATACQASDAESERKKLYGAWHLHAMAR